MSDPVTGGATVRAGVQTGMIALRGDISSDAFMSACKELTGLEIPRELKVSSGAVTSLLWMSPDEVLILLPPGDVPLALAAIATALDGLHHLAVDLSDARAMVTVTGPSCREVLARLAPVDLHPDAFGPGDFRRSRLGQIAAAFWMPDPHSFTVICFRSVAEYALDLLTASAAPGPAGVFPA